MGYIIITIAMWNVHITLSHKRVKTDQGQYVEGPLTMIKFLVRCPWKWIQIFWGMGKSLKIHFIFYLDYKYQDSKNLKSTLMTDTQTLMNGCNHLKQLYRP